MIYNLINKYVIFSYTLLRKTTSGHYKRKLSFFGHKSKAWILSGNGQVIIAERSMPDRK